MHPQQSNCRREECGHCDKCLWVESGTREEQVILLEAPVERLAPQRLVVLFHRVKDESLPSWEVTSASHPTCRERSCIQVGGVKQTSRAGHPEQRDNRRTERNLHARSPPSKVVSSPTQAHVIHFPQLGDPGP